MMLPIMPPMAHPASVLLNAVPTPTLIAEASLEEINELTALAPTRINVLVSYPSNIHPMKLLNRVRF